MATSYGADITKDVKYFYSTYRNITRNPNQPLFYLKRQDDSAISPFYQGVTKQDVLTWSTENDPSGSARLYLWCNQGTEPYYLSNDVTSGTTLYNNPFMVYSGSVYTGSLGEPNFNFSNGGRISNEGNLLALTTVTDINDSGSFSYIGNSQHRTVSGSFTFHIVLSPLTYNNAIYLFGQSGGYPSSPWAVFIENNDFYYRISSEAAAIEKNQFPAFSSLDNVIVGGSVNSSLNQADMYVNGQKIVKSYSISDTPYFAFGNIMGEFGTSNRYGSGSVSEIGVWGKYIPNLNTVLNNTFNIY